MKVINVKKISALLFAASLALFSCSNFSDSADFSKPAAATGADVGGTASVSFKAGPLGGGAKTIQPGAADDYLDALTDIHVYGTPSGGSSQELASPANRAALEELTLELSPAGAWTFEMTAKIDGVEFSATSAKTIAAGKPNSVAFDLKAGVNYGGLSVTVNFAGSTPSKVVAALFERNKTTKVNEAEITSFGDGSTPAPTFTYERAIGGTTGLAAGTYYLNFDFYKNGVSEPVNSFGNYVRIVNGITSRATFNINLNELYSITYKYYLDGVELTDTTVIAEIIDSISGGTLPEKFSRKSEINLPELSHDGWEFKGWYPTAAVVSDSKMTKIAVGTTGNQTLCAMFVSAGSVTVYAASDGIASGSSVSSVEEAVSFIKNNPDSAKDWVIGIAGTLAGCQTLVFGEAGTDIPVASSCAKSITLTGLNSVGADGKPNDWIDAGSGWNFSEDAPCDIGGAQETNEGCPALEVSYCNVPLTITNLGIKGGYGRWAGGISFGHSNTLTLGENSYIVQNISNNSGSGIYIDQSVEVIIDGGTIEKNMARSSISDGGGVYIKDATFTLKNGSVSNNWLDAGAEDDGAGVYVDAGGVFKMQGGTVADNVAIDGMTGGVFVKGKFNMTGGTISGNKAYNGHYDPAGPFVGHGVYVSTEDVPEFTMGGDAVIASGNDVYLMYDSNNSSLPRIKITSELTGYAAGQKIMITPDENGYANNMPVLYDEDGGALVAQCYSLFEVAPHSTVEWTVNASGCLSNGSGTSGSVTYYVAPSSGGGSSSGDGSSAHPFDSISAAYLAIKDNVDGQSADEARETDYIIKVDGMLEGPQCLNPSYTYTSKQIKSLTIEGARELVGGVPQDGIDAGLDENSPEDDYASALSINSANTVNIKNLKITGGYNNEWSSGGGGLCVGGFDGIEGYSYSCVVLEDGVLITGNSAANGAGVYVSQRATLVMEGGTISGNTLVAPRSGTERHGSGIYLDERSATLELSGSAQIASGSDIYLEASTSKIVVAGPLSQTNVATITPYQYQANDSIISLKYDDSKGSYIDTTTLAAEHAKFAITPNGSTNYEIDENGLLQVATGGGSVPAGFVAVDGDTINCADLNVTDYDNQTSLVFAAARGTVTVDDLYVCDHEVTREEYAQYMGWCDDAGTFRTTNATDGTANDDKAAHNISWLEAIMYCNLRSIAEDLDPVYYIVVDGDGNAVQTETGTKVYDVEQWIGKFTWEGQSYVQKDGATGKYYTYNKNWGNGGYPDLYDGDYIKWDHDSSRKGYRLPTEIEWEYCARGGKEGIRMTQGVYGGDTTTTLSAYAVTQYIVQVRTKTPNHLQLYDMIGNVREWCWDKHCTDAQVVNQGLYGYEGTNYQHVQRGGSSSDSSQYPNYLKLWSRVNTCGANAGTYYGFRICCNQ